MEVTRGASKRQRTEAKHALEVLPGSAWSLVLKKLSPYDRVTFGLTCKTFLEAVTTANPEEKKKALPLRTDLTNKRLYEKMPCFSLDWFQWVFRSFERRKGESKKWRNGESSSYLYDSDLMHLAAFQGSKKAVKWLVSQGIPLDIKHKYCHGVGAARGAAAGGHVELLEWLRSEGCGFDEETCSAAAYGGRIDVLQWLRSQDPPCPWDMYTCCYAAEGGHLDVLQWLRSQDPPCDWDEETCAGAASGGHLDVLKWARSQDPPCPWDEVTCEGAARGGPLEILQWARSQDPPCPWGSRTCFVAAHGGHLHILQWARSQDPPCDWHELASLAAAAGGHLDVLQWLRSQNPPCPWNPEECKRYAANRHPKVLKWIQENS
ncbi:ankyrin repeat domain-containing protein [Chloropicon primus]|uniref:Ankyrin repeat domain-containing protein n=1 Tax=Chloropicon primus TaxID=1764295 RepID=A0A5B8ML76_9CHLO|nr:ankyrin repeat domain-containing protein [Chloropicon primus]UPQ99344.1 ankyrin repeat domain-containing protein [Chloropicon primus]|eukprot:QDZ20132.1 ankyrin repeat domain-containing protein [Chloropicon primus]